MVPGTRTVRPYHYLTYGVADVFGAGSMAVIAGWILFFYSTFCGLTTVQASGIFAIARLLDAVWSPLLGHISDSIGTTRPGRRFGRRRVFLLCAVPLLPSFALMWVSGHTYLYYLCTYVFFELTYASVLVPYSALAPEMTDDYQQLSKFAGVRLICAQVSAILAGILPNLIINVLGGKDSADTFLYMGIAFSALFMVVVWITYRFSWEREASAPTVAAAPATVLGILGNLFHNVISTLRIRAFRLHLGMYLGGYISQDIFNAVFTYFVVFVLAGNVALASAQMGAMAFAQLIAVVCFIPLILRLQPAPAFRLASIIYIIGIVGLACLYLLHPASLTVLLYVPVLIAGFGRGGLNFIPWNIYNYIAEVDEIVTAERRPGVFSGVMVITRKTTMAVAVMAVGWILGLSGFVPGAASQSALANETITIVLVAGPIILLLMGIAISFRFKLTQQTHAVLLREIARFKRGESVPPSEEDRQILQDLTGWPFEQLWGKNPVRTSSQRAPRVEIANR
jgi:oligogalacturonide transporter